MVETRAAGATRRSASRAGVGESGSSEQPAAPRSTAARAAIPRSGSDEASHCRNERRPTASVPPRGAAEVEYFIFSCTRSYFVDDPAGATGTSTLISCRRTRPGKVVPERAQLWSDAAAPDDRAASVLAQRNCSEDKARGVPSSAIPTNAYISTVYRTQIRRSKRTLRGIVTELRRSAMPGRAGANMTGIQTGSRRIRRRGELKWR